MKTLILLLALTCAIPSISYAEYIFGGTSNKSVDTSLNGVINDWADTQDPIYYTQSVATNAFSLYFVNTTTNTNATYNIATTSIQFTCHGGKFAGTTQYYFADANKNTIGELVAFINAISSSTIGCDGGICANLVQGAYENNLSTGLTHATTTYILGPTNQKMTAFGGEQYGITYTLPASLIGDRIFLTGLVINGTFNGNATLNIYNSSSTATKMWGETAITTATDKVINIHPQDFMGKVNTFMRIDFFATAPLSSAWIEFTYKKRH